MTRVVVVLCGPPGAGKSTLAADSGLTVWDRDDPQWTCERHFTRAVASLAHDPDAHAVVIRSGATSSARTRWRTLVQATHCLLVLTPPDECARRITARGRPDHRREIAAARRWWARHDRLDGTPPLITWDDLGPASTPPPRSTPPPPRKGTASAGYGYRHRQQRRQWQQQIDAGRDVRCWRCGAPIIGTDWHLGHDDDDRTIWRGPECIPCNLGAAARKTNAKRGAKEPTPPGW